MHVWCYVLYVNRLNDFWLEIYRMNMPHSIQIIATVLFAVAIVHTFSVPVFARLAHKNGPHAGLWHFLSEVEAVFGLWAFVLLVVMAMLAGVPTMVNYVDTTNFTEPLFVFAIMVVAASRPILELVGGVESREQCPWRVKHCPGPQG